MRNSVTKPYHVHDIRHNTKYAEASLERGSHFDGEHTYDSTDLAVLLSTLESQRYDNFIAAVSHKNILQFDNRVMNSHCKDYLKMYYRLVQKLGHF